MSVEARTERNRLISKPMHLTCTEAKHKLENAARSIQLGISRLVNPPFNTPDGKPLEVRFYEPGQVILFDLKQTFLIQNFINQSSKQ
jgi:hypothetical protein